MKNKKKKIPISGTDKPSPEGGFAVLADYYARDLKPIEKKVVKPKKKL